MLLHHSWWCLFQHHRQISPFYRRNKPRPTGIHTPLLDAMERLVIFKTFSLFSVTVRSLDSTCCFPWPLHLTRMNSRKWCFWPSTDNWDKWHGTAIMTNGVHYELENQCFHMLTKHTLYSDQNSCEYSSMVVTPFYARGVAITLG